MIYRSAPGSETVNLEPILCGRCGRSLALIYVAEEPPSWFCRPCFCLRYLRKKNGRRKVASEQKIEKLPQSFIRYAQMKELIDSGATLQAVGQEFGISRERVRQIAGNVRKARETSRAVLLEEKRATVLALWNAGYPQSEISRETGLSPTVIAQIELPRPARAKPVRHGTVSGYHRGCHCARCLRASAQRIKNYYHDRRRAGLCVSCGAPSQTWRCPQCVARHRK